MTLDSLTLTNFKNIPHATLEFSPKLNTLLGDNGMGKSNLLDAIYYLSFCRSYTGLPDASLVRSGEELMMLCGNYTRHGLHETLNAGLSKGHRKTFRRSGKEYKRLSEHIGKFPLVMVSPSDMDLVNGTGEERRKFVDMIISQTDAGYLEMLIHYQKSLEQRNRMLRDGIADLTLYMAVEYQMERAAEYIVEGRRRWTEEFSAIFSRYYADIAGEGEAASLAYTGHMAQPGTSLGQLLDANRERDRILKHTTVGPHRDDLQMRLSSMPVRRTASQGQAKTYTIAMRLAQYDFLKAAAGIDPILLLDDIFDKLDATRVARIMDVVARDTFGQIFITDTNRKHLDEILAATPGGHAMWTVDHGEFSASALPLPLEFS